MVHIRTLIIYYYVSVIQNSQWKKPKRAISVWVIHQGLKYWFGIFSVLTTSIICVGFYEKLVFFFFF